MVHELLVLGAGYAGLAAARHAAHHARHHGSPLRVTLVNATDTFVERVRLHEVAAGRDVGVHPLSDSLDPSVDLVVGRAEALDLTGRAVDVRVGDRVRALRYDTLVHALGSAAALDGAPGVAEHAASIAGLEEARDLARRIATERPRTLTVVGGGLTGLEAVTELAETHPDLRAHLITSGPVAADTDPRGRAHVLRVLDRLGVAVHEHTRVAAVEADHVKLEDGDLLETDLTVWNAGFTVPSTAADAGLTVDGDGRALVDGTQRSVSHPDVYVVGDAAHVDGVDGRALRMSCAMGLPMGWSSADAIAARLAGREPDASPFGYLTRCVSLGRRDGLVQFVRADDSPRRLILTGRTAARVKEMIVASAYGGLKGHGRSRLQADTVLSLARGSARRFPGGRA
ncbi:FAD-dependent oxidoreductase [Nocardiopsis sp. N85]|uniref:NAD(P)/FAD-dependent oxidoreductase n=1 Tax=Nocardiopsis sp. N85 TaxID=3029400 RepID=UPI00237F7400|nr:FAD-dependent oxidoreductase [Nocardiopsis sp. N85]MDE3722278.1 FAD-dependent oxidoreductase [Nocardiopsis sp. N85]